MKEEGFGGDRIFKQGVDLRTMNPIDRIIGKPKKCKVCGSTTKPINPETGICVFCEGGDFDIS